MKVFNPKETRPYTIEGDTTVFFIGGLDPHLHAHLSNNLLDNEKHQTKAGSIVRDTVKFGVKGWENLTGLDDSPIVFEEKTHTQSWPTPIGPRRGLTDAVLNLIPWAAQQKLFAAIQDSNNLSEQDVKNSDSPSAQS